ncbi:MAG: hypothetical protein NTV43_04010 [Methylococcales bacterium]|nr:hypothetical protein [Methylococcales bacterium]
MATTSYFEGEIPTVNDIGKADKNKPTNLVEIYISSFSNDHELYLKHIDGEGNESRSILNKDQAKRMLKGLNDAMFFLGYVR